MIRIYPSRLESEPLESHAITEPIGLVDWLKALATDFELDREHPIFIEVDGVLLPVDQWESFVVQPDTDLRIYPQVRGVETIIVLALVAIAAVSLAMMMSMTTPGGSQPGQGKSIDTNPAKVNRAKVNELRGAAGVAVRQQARNAHQPVLVPWRWGTVDTGQQHQDRRHAGSGFRIRCVVHVLQTGREPSG